MEKYTQNHAKTSRKKTRSKTCKNTKRGLRRASYTENKPKINHLCTTRNQKTGSSRSGGDRLSEEALPYLKGAKSLRRDVASSLGHRILHAYLKLKKLNN